MVSYSMVKMFPAQIRFSGISFSYNLAYAIAGGITLPLVQWLSLYIQYWCPVLYLDCVSSDPIHCPALPQQI